MSSGQRAPSSSPTKIARSTSYRQGHSSSYVQGPNSSEAHSLSNQHVAPSRANAIPKPSTGLGSSRSVRLPSSGVNLSRPEDTSSSSGAAPANNGIGGTASLSKSRDHHASKMAPPSSFKPTSNHKRVQSTSNVSTPSSRPSLSTCTRSSISRSSSSCASRNHTPSTPASRSRDSTVSTSAHPSLSNSARPSLSSSNHSRSTSTTSATASTNPKPTTSSSASSSTSTSTPTPKKPFSAYRRDFTPASRRSRHATSSQPQPQSHQSHHLQRPNRASHASQPNPQLTPSLPLRPQLHLLHLSLLHQSAQPTLAQYTSSAHQQLSARFTDLQNLYTSLLTLRRTANQQRNLLLLHSWGGGNGGTGGNWNALGLCRKLSGLCGVLGEVCTLTRPAWVVRRGRSDGRGGEGDGGGGGGGDDEGLLEGRMEREGGGEEEVDVKEQEEGRYAMVVSAFESWVGWVEEVWGMRDRIRDDPTNDSADAKVQGEDLSLMPIEGLGDGMKAEIRALQSTVNALAVRLSDLAIGMPSSSDRPSPRSTPCSPSKRNATPRSPSKPNTTPRSPSKLVINPRNTPKSPNKEQDGEKDEGKRAHAQPQPTPKLLLDLATDLTKGMQEELQLMKEIEFEVVVGERAWMEEMVRRVGGIGGREGW